MKVTVTRNTISSQLRAIKDDLKDLPKEVYDEFVSLTPVDTGNARRKTRLQGSTIKANYKYATRLDEGYSRQAPNGMSEPTRKFIQNRLRKILGK